MKYEKSCGCIVINNDKVLLIQHNEGHWEFPKGHMEKDETEVQTAIRETKEETNIDVEINEKYRYTIQYSPEENVWKEVVYFVATNKTDEIIPQISEVKIVKWVGLEEAISMITYDNSKDVLKQAMKDLGYSIS